MIFPGKNPLEEAIITHLQTKSWNIVQLIDELRKSRPLLSKQAVYQVIRQMKKAEIVISANKKVSLSSIWIDKMAEFFATARYAYVGADSTTPEMNDNSFLGLSDGDSISYNFRDPNSADMFWAHAFHILLQTMPDGEPIYIYDPHQWFLLARPETEVHLMNLSNELGHPWYMYVPNQTKLDEHTKSVVTNPSQIAIVPKHYYKPNYYFNVFGDFIIEAHLDPQTQQEIDEFYLKTEIWNENASDELIRIITTTHGRNKLSISKNHKKANKIKAIIGRFME